MSAGSISLESAIRTCKVDTAYAAKIESDRFLNPNNMVCPVWNGMDTAGRRVCPDSFMTKRAGCNSAEDRVVVENAQRPQYSSYINLSANGIAGHIYGGPQASIRRADKDLSAINKITGNFGSQFGANVYPSCAIDPYHQSTAQESQRARENQAVNEGYTSSNFRCASGF